MKFQVVNSLQITLSGSRNVAELTTLAVKLAYFPSNCRVVRWQIMENLCLGAKFNYRNIFLKEKFTAKTQTVFINRKLSNQTRENCFEFPSAETADNMRARKLKRKSIALSLR